MLNKDKVKLNNVLEKKGLAPAKTSIFSSFKFRFILCVFAVLLIVQWPVSGITKLSGALILPQTLSDSAEVSMQVTAKPISPTQLNSGDLVSIPSLEYVISSGDTLSGIFGHLALSQKTMYQVLESDISLLALDTLKPGNRLQFWINDDYELVQLELVLDLAHQAIYKRLDSKSFSSEERFLEGRWQPVVLKGVITHSMGVDGKKAGLTINEIDQISELFKEKIKFSRDLRAGDRFSILRNQQYIAGVKNNRSKLLAVLINNQKIPLSAFLNDDANYYDQDGKSLSRAFLRYPTKRQYRISSRFNPRRKHPVTGRISPHNGTDFATPMRTPIMATGDGVVSKVKNHPYAGKYIEIDHGGSYRTRFLHLSKFLVSKGQKVSRGKVIALSGNTGRSTGAHLHFEFHINGRAVNPMTTWIPTESSVPKKYKSKFAELVKQHLALLGGEQAGSIAVAKGELEHLCAKSTNLQSVDACKSKTKTTAKQ